MSACGLLGSKLGHSLSPQIHSMLGSYSYALFEKTEGELPAFLHGTGLRGLNVTIPYKETVLPFCDTVSDAVRKIGSVNTLIFEQGKIHGENTDAYGFAELLQQNGISVSGKKVLVLGSGGASKAVQYVLRREGAETVVISRRGENNYVNLNRNYDGQLIVNTTPVGMYPHNENSPIDLAPFTRCEAVIDLIYNPCRTALLLQAETLGIRGVNGLYMLVAQAKKAAELFENRKIPDEQTEIIYQILLGQAQNLVLIGMPSCGKTTVGRLLAEHLQRPFFDCDEIFTQQNGCSPGDYILQSGEAAFRREETKLLKELCKQLGCVIATGGGVVERAENEALCRQNGILIYLDRPLSQLTAEGRPLSRREGMEALAQRRLPLYRAWADIRAAESTPEAFAQTIRKELKL